VSSDNGGGVRFVKVRDGLYTSSPSARFELERVDCGMTIKGTDSDGTRHEYTMIGGASFWIAVECNEGRRTAIGKAPTLRAARGLVAAHLKRTEAVEAAAAQAG
jgi:hypothetical protein